MGESLLRKGPSGAAGLRGRVFNIQRFSLQDGPGLRTTVFLKGCPLACAWCHNPESQKPETEVFTQEERCIRCGACRAVCKTWDSACVRCGACVEACPTGARQMAGSELAVEDLVRDLLRDRIFFEQSGGGVTLSGGEPLTQPAFSLAVTEALHAEGIPVALDTCGFGRREDLLALADLADPVLFDLKLVDPARHEAATGQSNGTILENLAALGDARQTIWIRVPILPGINDDEANLEATACIAAGTPGVRRVDLLPYHATGEAKFARLGRSYALSGLEPPAPGRMDAIAERFRAQGLTVNIGGRS